MRDEEKMHVTITLDKQVMMHVVYWIIIVTLGILLTIAWLKDCEAPDSTPNEVADEVQQGVGTVVDGVDETAEEVDAAPAETCSDGLLNQDETDVDCGGTCNGCAIGETCETANDCIADYCTDGKCSSTKPEVLSGKVELSITKVDIEVNPSNEAVKVTDISYSIDNGLSDDLGTITLKAYVKSKKDSTYCLSQIPAGTERDCANPYATWTILGPDSGDDTTKTQDLSSSYFGPSYVSNYGSTTYYQNGDDFQVWLYIYDDNGNLINGKEVSSFRTVSP